MKTKLFFIILVALFVGSCSSYEKPTLKEISSVKITIKKKFTKLNGTLIFMNPNAENIGLNEMYFDVLFNGNDVGSYTKKSDAIIPAQGQISLPFYIEINNEEYDVSSNEIEMTIKGYINGKIKSENISLSFDEKRNVLLNGKISKEEDSDKTKEEIRQEKKEQKKIEKEQKKEESIKRKALKEVNS
jgi:LEA14-like dessication related protein